ncbi:hypothetical protein TRAPUB_1450 [Trametes pubescens]|uniref:RanBD1 domain-containing protein n=1 Tax=Trametes pubescens TaxID=154538 RepID=A0A1M2VJC6_TRAPU|nr:hypothetical protein TRAPUB_1450 [Trametes pubescens]
MFPLNDFNFVACALATVSAAVGYRVSRGRTRGANGSTENDRAQGRFHFFKFPRRNSTVSARAASVAATERDGTEPPTSEYGTPLPAGQEHFSDDVEEGSLKRKRSASPEVPHPGDSSPKRLKTSEPEDHGEVPIKVEEIAPQSLGAACTDGAHASADIAAQGEMQTGLYDSAPVSEPNDSPAAEPPALLSSPPPALSPTPVAPVAKSPFAPRAPVWPSTPSAIIAAKPSAAFQAFSGSPSAFSSAAAGLSPSCPVWSTSDNVTTYAATASDPLAALSYATSTQTTITGEEDEEAIAELKGAKVFIKRGERDFCEGIMGTVKLLKHKETGHERILFRREPVMKVSMNVRLRPLVRCSFDEAQGQLRVALMEPAEDTQQERVVVYALKRGKASRTEFADFAEAVMESARVVREQQQAPSRVL